MTVDLLLQRRFFFLFVLLRTTKIPGHHIQNKCKTILKGGEKADWLVTLELQEPHGDKFPGFPFSYIPVLELKNSETQ
jgi:hypothetical protein